MTVLSFKTLRIRETVHKLGILRCLMRLVEHIVYFFLTDANRRFFLNGDAITCITSMKE